MSSVVLATLPFAPFERPSAQLGILKSLLAREGTEAEDRYLTLDFFELLHSEGLAAHYTSSTAALIAEWYFSDRPFDPKPGGKEFFLSFRLKEYARQRGLRWEDMLRLKMELAPAFLDRAAQERWDGVKLLCLTLSFPQVMASVGLARRVKERHPTITVVMGGAYTQLHEESARELMRLYPCLDSVVLGDAEPVFASLAASVLDGRGVPDLPGVLRRDGEEVRLAPGVNILKNFDNYPVPDYGGFFARARALSRGAAACLEQALPLELSRGCPWGRKRPCAFCAFSPHQAYALKPPGAVMREMAGQARRYGVKGFYSLDTALPAHLVGEALVPARREDPALHLTFVEVRTDLSRGRLEALKEAGTGLLQPGIEALDDGLLVKMAKGVTLAQNLVFLKSCRELGLRLSWNLILGLPDATREEVERQLRLLPLLHHLEPPYPMPLAYVRFSSYWREDRRTGSLGLEPEPFYRALYPDGADLEALAFEYVARHGRPELAPLYRQTLDAVEEWRRLWQSGAPPRLLFTPGGGGAWLDDTRNPDAPVRHRLDGAAAAAYEACLDGPAPPAGALAGLVEKGLVAQVGEEYLALATRS